jgi:uncharacterized membrane-anchored protein
MTTTKVTKRENYESLLKIEEVKANDELVAFIKHEMELLAKKASRKSNSKTKTQKENEEVLKPAVTRILENTEEGMTATEIAQAITEISVSVPRVSAMLKKLVADGAVIREVVKGKPYFTIATDEE